MNLEIWKHPRMAKTVEVSHGPCRTLILRQGDLEITLEAEEAEQVLEALLSRPPGTATPSRARWSKCIVKLADTSPARRETD